MAAAAAVARALQDSGIVAVTSRSGAADVAGAITTGRMDLTVRGASTLTIDLIDDDRVLVASSVAREESTVRWAGRTWVLVRVSRQAEGVQLVFEPAAVVALRRRRGVKKAAEGAVTRIDFMRGLARDAKVAVWVPPLDRGGLSRTVRPAVETQEKRQPGFARGASFRVKGRVADGEQRSVAVLMLNSAWTVTVGRPAAVRQRALVMTTMAATQESSIRNLTGGDRDSQGVFQQRVSSGYKNRRNVPLATRDFLTWAPGRPAALAVMVGNPGRSLGWAVSQAQRDYTFGTSRQGVDYDVWRRESEATVQAWTGGAALTDTPRGGLVSRRDAWERQADESSWDAMQRLCDEIQLRCFEESGRIVISDDATLQSMAPDVTITPAEAWVTDITFDYDVGLRSAEARVAGTLAAGQLVQGRAVQVTGYGAADGRWIVETITSDLHSDDVDVTLTRPKPVLPEPAVETSVDSGDAALSGGVASAGGIAAATSQGALLATGNVVIANQGRRNMTAGGVGGDWAGSGPLAESIAVTSGLPVSSRKRGRVNTASGNTSDHYQGATSSYAVDLACVGARGDQALARIMAVLGRPDYKGGSWLNLTVGGYRFQVGWRVAGHFDHIHVGVKKA